MQVKVENFSRFHKPEKKSALCLLFAILIEVVAFGVTVPLHTLLAHLGATLQPSVDVAGEVSDPTVGRFNK